MILKTKRIIVFGFREMIFEGFKLKKSKKYSDEYFENLLSEDNCFNRIKYKQVVEDQIDESIHIKLSYSLIVKVLSILGIIVSLILGLNKLFVPGIICIIIAFGFQLVFDNLKIRIKERYSGKEQWNKELVDFIFESNK